MVPRPVHKTSPLAFTVGRKCGKPYWTLVSVKIVVVSLRQASDWAGPRTGFVRCYFRLCSLRGFFFVFLHGFLLPVFSLFLSVFQLFCSGFLFLCFDSFLSFHFPFLRFLFYFLFLFFFSLLRIYIKSSPCVTNFVNVLRKYSSHIMKYFSPCTVKMFIVYYKNVHCIILPPFGITCLGNECI